ncbi:MAG: hypothetical protein H7296_13220 [Bacteroidia bacterium]|nr:hypothetical protein [Bacteroidia bacterium]
MLCLLIIHLLGAYQLPSLPDFKLLTSIIIQAKDMQTDRMGNLYVISQTNQLYKYDLSGKLVSTLNYAYIGNITHIDASNPFELYLFYRELNAVVFLDNNLAYRGRINLSDANVIQASSAARNYANGLWVFDQGDLQLKKIERNGKVEQMSGNVLQFAQTKTLAPNFIFDNGSRVFVNDSLEGIMVFDVFANYQKTIPVKGLKNFKVLGDELYYVEKKNLVAYHLKTLQRKFILLPDSNYKEVGIEKEHLYLQKPDTILIYMLPVKGN